MTKEMFGDIVSEGATLCYRDELSPSEAAAKLIHKADGDTVMALARVGLAALIGDELHQERSRGPETSTRPRSGRYRLRGEHRSRAVSTFWLEKTFSGADSHSRSIIDFGPEDWDFNLDRAASHLRGYKRQIPFWKQGVELMHLRGAEKTHNLPDDEIRSLNELAEAAFR